MNKGKTGRSAMLFLIPSLLGMGIFYVIPLVGTFLSTLMSGVINPTFVGLKNYQELITNPIFRLGLKNTLIFISMAVPIGILVSLVIALGIKKLSTHKRLLQCIVLIPLVIPTASVAFFWKKFFEKNGPFTQLLSYFVSTDVDWLQSNWGLFIMVFIYVWKNLGYNTILFTAALYNIPDSYYESAALDGGSGWRVFRYITLPCILPTGGIVMIMSIMNSFKVFKEIYLIADAYPHESMYLLQHYMNNVFNKLDYQKLTTAAYIFLVLVIIGKKGFQFMVRRGCNSEG
ncbi:MAG: sugar ABC transporter permease [Cellulosilyticum sp.]|nr:sugar ABC transporter permease [Cellulosilyticum sp.]